MVMTVVKMISGPIHHRPPKVAVAPTLSRASKCRSGFHFWLRLSKRGRRQESTPLTSFPQLAHGRLVGEE